MSSGSDDVLLLPLDVAIKKSIESCSSDELKKKMYSCILIVGGGLRMKGLPKFLNQRLVTMVSGRKKFDICSSEALEYPNTANLDYTFVSLRPNRNYCGS